MGSEIASWKMSIGLFYGMVYGMVMKNYLGTVSFSFIFLTGIFMYFKKLFWVFISLIYNSINNLETAVLVWLLIILSGDVE